MSDRVLAELVGPQALGPVIASIFQRLHGASMPGGTTPGASMPMSPEGQAPNPGRPSRQAVHPRWERNEGAARRITGRRRVR